jgi:hypothetical protein
MYIYIYVYVYNKVSNITFQCSASSPNNTARPVCMTSLVTQGWQTRSFLHQSHFVSQHAGSPCYNRLTQTTVSTLCYWYRSVLSATDRGYAYYRNILTVRRVFLITPNRKALSSSKTYLRCTKSYCVFSISLVNLPAKNGRVISGRINKRDELFVYQKLWTNLSGSRVMCSNINGTL